MDGSLGQVAQLVEQWTENPCVGGSIPPLSTLQVLSAPLLAAIDAEPQIPSWGALLPKVLPNACHSTSAVASASSET